MSESVTSLSSGLSLRGILHGLVAQWRKEAETGAENARKALAVGLKYTGVMSTGMAVALREKADELAAALVQEPETDDLSFCRQILAADMTVQPSDAPLPEPSLPIPVGTVAYALYGAIQELRERRGVASPSLPQGPKK